MKNAIDSAMARILRLPLWGIDREVGFCRMHIGGHQMLFAGSNSSSGEVGEFVIHIECPWTWTKDGVELANQDSDSCLIDQLAKPGVICESVRTHDNWATEIRFEDNATLTIRARPRTGLRERECWRLMEPAEDQILVSVGSKDARS